MKICITCSPGGHLAEVLKILPILDNHAVFFYTIDVQSAKKTLRHNRSYFVSNPVKNPFKHIVNFFYSLRVIFVEKPRVIISSGAGVTIPITFLSKILFGSKIIYLECSAQVYKPSLTGRLVYTIADLFFVQWKYLLKFYKEKAVYGGRLLLY